MITPATIQQIQQRIDVLDVVGEFVKLKKRGVNYLGLCPFHNEKTPSFTVSPGKEIYKCFGCGKSGNAISFIMEHEKYSYVDALKWLANRYGVEVEETYVNDEQRQQILVADSLYIINQFAQQFFTRQLFETEEGRTVGLSYFKERGFREDVIKKFQLGYSPEQRDALTKEALNSQYSQELMLKSGLLVNRNEQLQDNYRGRIIFPVHNQSGKIAGFGARVIKSTDKAPKYINTPENEVYVKSRILYGSFFARTAIAKLDECLLVEGYTDVVSLHQAGIENVVASGGTSLTVEQLRLVKKFTNNLTILYDGDAAGIKAAIRGLDLALEEGIRVKLALIPNGEDPDSYVHKFGAAAFQEFIEKNKKDFILFQLEVSLKDAGTDSVKKSELVTRIAETISKINKPEDFTRRQDYIKESAELLHIDEQGLHTLVNTFTRNRLAALEKKQEVDVQKEQQANAEKGSESNFAETTFLLLHQDELQEKEIVRILLEHGSQPWGENINVAGFIFQELPEDSLFNNADVLKFLMVYKERLYNGADVSADFFIYHQEPGLSSLAVSLLNFPYEVSPHWRKDVGKAIGFQKELFAKSYEDFMKMVNPKNEDDLLAYLKTEESKVGDIVTSALNYIKLKKVRRLLIQNQSDFETAVLPDQIYVLQQTHLHLKNVEMSLIKDTGTVIFK